MRRARKMVLAIVLLVVAAGVTIFLWFDHDMRVAREAVAHSQMAQTSVGPIEYADAGTGTPVLSIHGAGGGFDQGLTFAADLLGTGYRVVAPSRFGYLRSPVPADPSPGAQAEAHVALLDKLGIDRAIVIGVSAGARSAIELAVRHPERVRALLLIVPGTYAPDIPPIETTRGADFPLVLWLLAFGATIFALIHALRQRPDAFTAVDKLTKPIWLAILGVAVLLLLLSFAGLGLFAFIAIIATGIYLADVRPKVDEIQRGPRW